MKKFIASLALMLVSLFGVVAGTTAVAPPATAALTSGCIDLPRSIRTCGTVAFTPSNLVVNSFQLNTPNNCGNLEAEGGRYAYKNASTSNRHYYWGAQGCSSSHAVSYDACSGCSTRMVKMYTKARIDLHEDYEIEWTIYIRRDGSSTTYIDKRPIGDCC